MEQSILIQVSSVLIKWNISKYISDPLYYLQKKISIDVNAITTYVNNIIHNDSGPAIIKFTNEKLSKKCWMIHGVLHRIGGPALICYNESYMWHMGWYINGRAHRINKPALLTFSEYNGKVIPKEIKYMYKGLPHRTENPAHVFYTNGIITRLTYYCRGRLHNTKGPAFYSKVGNNIAWYNHGHECGNLISNASKHYMIKKLLLNIKKYNRQSKDFNSI